MEGNRLLTLLVTLSLVGTISLFAYSLSLEPVDKGIGEIGPEDVGSLVSVDGIVARVWKNSRGDLNVILADGEDYIRVYVPEERTSQEKDLLPGALINVKGEVQLYAGELEIYVTSPASIRILKKSMSDSISPKILAEMPEIFAGETVHVRGAVQNIHVVRDGRTLNLSAQDLWIEVDIQKEVSFAGRVDVYGSLVRMDSVWEILVSGDGDVVDHPSETPDGYEEVSLDILLELPIEWEGRQVAVKGLDVTFQAIGTVFDLAEDGYEITCMVFGWDWKSNPAGISEGRIMVFEAIWEYNPRRATWQLVSDYPSFST